MWIKKWSRIRGIARHKVCTVLPISLLLEQNLPLVRALSAPPTPGRGCVVARSKSTLFLIDQIRPPFGNSLFNALFFAKRYAGGRKKAHSKNWKPQSNILTSKACDIYTISGSDGTCRHRTTLFDGILEHMPDESNKTGT